MAPPTSQQHQPDARTLELQRPSTAAVLATHVEPRDDIEAERRRATFDVSEVAVLLNGSKEAIEKRERFAQLLQSTSWGNKDSRHFLTREEEYVQGLKVAFGIWKLMQEQGYSLDDGRIMRTLADMPGGLELHIGMFIPSIRSQGSPEQQAKWLPPCLDVSIIGTYAQTELGHGTFVRGLQTTATYDKQTQEFVVHTPTLSATKWWPGGLGKTATHAVVYARLFIDGKDCGPHGFIVQLRCLETHRPLPGIKVGDIGPKLGFGGVDNGYLQLDHVRIPRDHMLMRYSQVTPEGRYVPPPAANAKASYATMVFVRADIVRNAGHVLSRAVTIATRYCAVRRQTAARAGDKETQVLDYQNTAGTLLPLLANAYALHFMGESMMDMYQTFERLRDKGDFSTLPELHALSSGLKAHCTWVTADGIEACRRTCGGHGYSRLSGLPTLFQSYVQNVTWEGDNNVLCLQTARHLIKAAVGVLSAASSSKQQGVVSGQPKGSAAYLAHMHQELQARCGVQAPEGWDDVEVQAQALRHVATRLAHSAVSTLAEATRVAAAASGQPVPKGGLAFEGPAWSNSTLVLIRLARAHSMVVLHDTFVGVVRRGEASGRLSVRSAGVLRRLASLLALDHMLAHLGDWMQDGYLTGAQAEAMRAHRNHLLSALRPDAVALVDAFCLPDYLLNSALGRRDGDVYKALLDMAQGSPLNATEEGPAWVSVLKPMMTSGGAAQRRSRM